MEGNGTVTAPVTATGGSISAGGYSIGALTINGPLNLNGGTLSTQIGGTANGQFDLLRVTEGINLNSGTFDFSFLNNGFIPKAGDEWLFLAGSFSGSLENILFTGTPNGMTFSVTAVDSGLKLSVLSTVPVPATAWLMGSGLIGLVGIARRKK